MSANSKNSLARTFLLVTLGVVALLLGVKSLVFLVPTALLLWFKAAPALRSGRN